MHVKRVTTCPALVLGLIVSSFLPALAGSQPTVTYPAHSGVSQPLSEIAKTTPPPQFHGWIERKEHGSSSKITKVYHLPDPVIQNSEPQPDLGITIGFNFDGMNGEQAGGVIPPDTNGAVGDKQFFLITNFAFSIYDKTS